MKEEKLIEFAKGFLYLFRDTIYYDMQMYFIEGVFDILEEYKEKEIDLIIKSNCTMYEDVAKKYIYLYNKRISEIKDDFIKRVLSNLDFKVPTLSPFVPLFDTKNIPAIEAKITWIEPKQYIEDKLRNWMKD